MSEYPLFSDFGGETWRIRRFCDENDKRWSAFNPSIAYSPEEGYVVLIRSSNYFLDPETADAIPTIGGRVKTRMWLANLDKDWQIIESTMKEIDFSEAGIFFKRGAEDGRLYWRDGGWEFTATMKEPEVPFPRIGKFRLDGLKAKLVELYRTEDLQDVEKNWMPTYVKNPKFDYVYGPNSVYIINKGIVERREMTEEISKVRGGGPLLELEDKTYLSIIHEADNENVMIYLPRTFGYRNVFVRKYFHRFAKYSSDGTLIALSDRFKFDGVRIEFACGMVIAGDDLIISYGYKDIVSKLAKIKLSTALDSLKVV